MTHVRRATTAPNNDPTPAGLTLPEYEPPTHPLNPKAQRALQELIRNNDLGKLRKHFDAAADLLTEGAHNVNSTLSQRQQYVERVRVKAQRDGGEADEARRADLERHLEETRMRAEKLTQKMEESIRKLIDAEYSANIMEDGLKAVTADAVTSSQRLPQMQRPSLRDTQATAATTEEGEDEEMSGFDPTDPGATARGDSNAQSFDLREAFTAHLEKERDRYQSHSLSSRYASNNRYAQFKASLHDGMYGEDGPPLAHKSTWFQEGNEPAPGETATGGDGGDSDDDIAVARERISTKCPLTLREFEDVTTSTKCRHSFERSAIVALMKEGGRGARREVQCPVPGCDKQLTMHDLHTDPILVRKIRRIQQSRQTQMEEDELATSPMPGRLGRAQSVGSDSGEDIDDVERRTQAKTVKLEPKSSRPHFQPNGRRYSAAQVGGSDDDDDNGEE